MWWAAMQALLSHWRRKPLQLLTLIAGLALATALWSGVQAINAEARASYDDAADRRLAKPATASCCRARARRLTRRFTSRCAARAGRSAR